MDPKVELTQIVRLSVELLLHFPHLTVYHRVAANVRPKSTHFFAQIVGIPPNRSHVLLGLRDGGVDAAFAFLDCTLDLVSATVCPSFAPQCPQKRLCSGLLVLHSTQVMSYL